MNHIQLYLNDQLADLSDDHPIALTFQINNLAEVQNQQGNTSNQFKLPLTQNNRQILGFPDDVTFCTNAPYTQLRARYIVNGIEVMPNAIAEIQQVDDDFASIVLLSGNVDFFDSIDGKLYDMGDSTTTYGIAKLWQTYDHPWTLDTIYGCQSKTDGWIWPIVDYGQIDPDDFTQPINVRQMRPGFFLHTAIELLCQQAGYKASGPLLQDPLYNKLIVQFANDSFEHGTDYQNTLNPDGFSVTSAADQLFPMGGAASGNLHFTPGPNFTDGVNFITTKNMQGTINLEFDCFMYGHPGDSTKSTTSQVTISINLRDANGNQNVTSIPINFISGSAQKVGGSGGGLTWQETFIKQKLSYDTELAPGVAVNINFQTQNSQKTYWIFKAGARLSFTPTNQNVLYGQQVQCERIFPDVSQKDLLKDTLQRFGIICQTDTNNKTIHFASLKEIVNNIPNAKNWTSKVMNQGKQVNYQLGNYSQKNWLRYKFDNSVPTTVMPQYFADDFITINDKTINPGTPEQDLFVSIFAPSPNRPYYGGTIAQILKIDTSTDANATDFSIGTEPRLLVDKKYNLMNIGKTVTLTDGVGNRRVINDVISTPYFYKSDGDFNLSWNDKELPGLRSIYYPELQKVLQQTKKIVRYLLLTPRDITELDLLTPIYLQQDGAYFYINKVDSWLKGRPCKVELVRLG